jgi:hypothetical protein
MTGTIPESLRWRNLFLLDLGRNNFTGTLPYDLGENFVALRNLHLDHNNFIGTLPDSYINAGNGRVSQISIEHNELTGWVPGYHWHENVLGKWSVLHTMYLMTSASKKQTLTYHFSKFTFSLYTVSFTLHENLFSGSLDKDTCKQSVFYSGEMVELKADCEICDCDAIFCDNCNP